MTPTRHQYDKADRILKHLNEHGRGVLQGSAGVGKTTVADYIIGRMRGKVLCTAPTNKAVSVIQSKVTNTNDFSTIHSALSMRMRYSTNGKKTFMPMEGKNNRIFDGVKNVVIDEGSMISTELLEHIEFYATREGCNILFLGDEKQLNPVGEDKSPIFHRDYPTEELTEIIRQGEGNPIIELSRNLDNIWKKQDNRIGSKGFIYSSETDRVIDTLASVNGTDELKYLAWTNNDVNTINSMVRNRIYSRPRKVELGESLIFDSPYVDGKGNVLYSTNEEIRVEELNVVSHTFRFPVKSSYITKEIEFQNVKLNVYQINPGDKLPDGVFVVHETSEKALKDIFHTMSNACRKKELEYYDKDKGMAPFADIKYNHALTVHKSQGSTYGQTILNVGDIQRNRKSAEVQRLLYTGATRASELLILYNVR